jgi:hypothetical protein
MDSHILPRGIRCNNPGNIRKGDDWRGLKPVQSDPDFCEFESLEMGVRAMAKVLLTYEKKFEAAGKTVCIANIIARWAPPNENDTLAYCVDVAKRMGRGVTEPLDLGNLITLRALVLAIAYHENGRELDWDAATKGVRMALGQEI